MRPGHPPELLVWSPSPSPSPQPPFFLSAYHHTQPPPPHTPSKQQPIDFSPPLIAMVVIAAAAFLIVTYSRLLSRHFLPPLLRQFRRYRQWRRRRHLLLLPSSSLSLSLDVLDSPPYSLDLYGLDDSVIKSMPLSVYSPGDEFPGDGDGDCAVCLLEFVDNDYVRTLPLCVHSFHVDCIDVWLRSHATCPLCRARVLPPPPTTTTPLPSLMPVMSSSRIRPSFDDQGLLLDSFFLDPLPHPTRRSDSVATVPEILPDDVPMMLKRSYSFGFERYPATASPWRSRDHHRRGSLSSFWRRPSPFSSLTKHHRHHHHHHHHHHRVFSFRSNRKSPLFGRRRGLGVGGSSESACIRYTYYHSSSRGSKSMASPMFGRSSASSRMRCGDPEALISPERYREATGAVD